MTRPASRFRRTLKWALTLLTVVLAIGCGPWHFSMLNTSGRLWIILSQGYFHVRTTDAPDWTFATSFPGVVNDSRFFAELTAYDVELHRFLNYPWIYGTGATGDTWQLIVSLWPWLGISAASAVALWVADRRPRRGQCPRCGYNLTGNATGTCPECGKAATP